MCEHPACGVEQILHLHVVLSFTPLARRQAARAVPLVEATHQKVTEGPTLYLWPVRQWGVGLQRYATGSRRALFGACMSILKRRQCWVPAAEPLSISCHAATVSSTGRFLRLDSTPSMRSCKVALSAGCVSGRV